MSSRSQRVFTLVTRPQESGSELAARLREAGCEALWWPAFDLLPPEDTAEIQLRIARLDEFDLVVFVSPAAVHAFAQQFRRVARHGVRKTWPPGTWIAAVGAATREAALASLPGAMAARIIAPEGGSAADGGSEALIAAIQGIAIRPRSALVVRAQQGRQRLLKWMQERGIAVEEIIAYRRYAHAPSVAEWAALRAALAAGARLAVLYTSSEAVAVVAGQFDSEVALSDALADSIALCVHERIGQSLRARGSTDVRRCGTDVESILQALRAGAGPGNPAPDVDLLL